MGNNDKKVGKKAEPKREELEFIYAQIQNGLSDSAILDEMQDQPFDIRTPGFIKRRRTEFAAAKTVMERGIKKELDPLTIQRKQDHFKDIGNLIQRWQEQLNPKDADVLIPFLTPDTYEERSKYRNISQQWIINEDANKNITAWLPIEKEHLFEALKVHLPDQIWLDYANLKTLICDAIFTATKTDDIDEARGYISEINEAIRIVDTELEKITLKGIYEGKCDYCPD